MSAAATAMSLQDAAATAAPVLPLAAVQAVAISAAAVPAAVGVSADSDDDTPPPRAFAGYSCMECNTCHYGCSSCPYRAVAAAAPAVAAAAAPAASTDLDDDEEYYPPVRANAIEHCGRCGMPVHYGTDCSTTAVALHTAEIAFALEHPELYRFLRGCPTSETDRNRILAEAEASGLTRFGWAAEHFFCNPHSRLFRHH